jgi:molybdate/tungstate transport system ATP-binding protein
LSMLSIRNLEVIAGDFKLKIPSLDVEAGEYLVVLGASGVGKTLLLNVIAGLYKPNRGVILLEGKDSTNMPPEKRGITLVPQDYGLFPHMSVIENISYGLIVRKISRNEAFARARKIAETLGITSILERKPGSLSGGEKQRVALARALLVKPKLILLDEPLSSLDPALKLKGLELLSSIKGETTIIHVTHDILEALYLADRIAYIETGKLKGVYKPIEFVHSTLSRPYIDLLDLASSILRKVGSGLSE